jgi:hypothetical protein
MEGDLVLKVEGLLAGACVPELEACWRKAVSTMAERPVRVDLTDVCHIDKAGRELMTEMYGAGVRFTARGCAMRELIREVSEITEARSRAEAERAKAPSRK